MRAWLGCTCMFVAAVGCAPSVDCPPSTPPVPSEARAEAELPPASAPGPSEAGPEPVAEASVILLVRHAEKAADGTADPPLTEQGVRRAQCLATLLGAFEPTHLLTTQYRRTMATLEPLASTTGVAVTVIEAADAAAWTRALAELPPGSRAVVAGHSNTLPALVASLGGRLDHLDDRGNIPDDDYDRLVHVVRRGSGPAISYTTAYCTR